MPPRRSRTCAAPACLICSWVQRAAASSTTTGDTFPLFSRSGIVPFSMDLSHEACPAARRRWFGRHRPVEARIGIAPSNAVLRLQDRADRRAGHAGLLVLQLEEPW